MNRDEMVKELKRLTKEIHDTIDWGGRDPKDILILDLAHVAEEALALTEGVYVRFEVGDVQAHRDSHGRYIGKKRAERILKRYARSIEEAMTQAGNEAIDTAITLDEEERETLSKQKRGLKAGKPFATRCTFALDELRAFSGYTYGETWNGWECPYFEKHEAEQIMKLVSGQGYTTSYDQASDTYSYQHTDDEEPWTAKGEDIKFQGQTRHVYPIGAWHWTWSKVEK